MSSVECLRGFINERLTAAAEEIFGVFQKTIVEYEEEIDRQRKLLDVIWKPEIKLHRIELPQQPVCMKPEVLADQLLCNQEIDTSMLIPPYEESDHSEPEPNSDQQLLFHNSHVAESQNQEGGKHGDSGSTRAAEPEPKKRLCKSLTNNMKNSAVSESHCDAHTAQKEFKCDTCGKTMKYKSHFMIHQRTHTGEKPYQCNSCGKRFSQRSVLNTHTQLHTGEKPFSCDTCGKSFRQISTLNTHMRLHTGEKPFSCRICGKGFRCSSNLKVHMRNHTDDKMYLCKICGIKFDKGNLLKAHMRVHREVV